MQGKSHEHAFCQSVPFLHGISGTDTTSALCGIGKKALGATKAFNEATIVFGSLFYTLFQSIKEDDEILSVIQ